MDLLFPQSLARKKAEKGYHKRSERVPMRQKLIPKISLVWSSFWEKPKQRSANDKNFVRYNNKESWRTASNVSNVLLIADFDGAADHYSAKRNSSKSEQCFERRPWTVLFFTLVALTLIWIEPIFTFLAGILLFQSSQWKHQKNV